MKFLDNLAEMQIKHTKEILIAVILITILLGFGLTKISMQSDLNKMMPQDLEIYKLSNKIKDNFGGQDSSIILLRIDDVDKESIQDIRDPSVLKFLVELESSLKEEELIEGVYSVGMFFTESAIPSTLSESKQTFSNIPITAQFFNKDYSATIMMISSDLGGGEDKIKELENLINEKVSKTSKPEGVNIYITGTPQIRSMILDLLVSDAIYTITISSIIIFILLIIIQRSFSKSIVIFIPLILGIVWTLGAMGWMNIKLSVATVGIGAMILGLGVEYGIFIMSRYSEERKIKNLNNAIKTAVKDVGSSVLGSGMTTITGFLALTLSMMPMMRDLGLSLAMGISFSLLSAIVVNPLMIIIEEKFQIKRLNKKQSKIKDEKAN